jgi:uncharacterized caspase-like protein
MNRILILLASLFFAGESFALPPCPTSGYWDNCFGTASANGGKYIGEFKAGKIHGQGTFTYAGNKYAGEWKDGTQHGKGTYTYADGDKYAGEWKDGTQHGKGTYTYADGDKYIGEFKDGKIHGQGTFTYAKGQREGDKYVGEYKDGKIQKYGEKSKDDTFGKENIWCVSGSNASYVAREYCYDTLDGTMYSTEASAKEAAQAEYKRLKGTVTASTSGSKSVWCAGASSSYVFKTTKTYCKSINRKSFPTKAQAQAEHERLKGIATASTSASNLTSSDSGRFYCYESKNNLFYVGSRNGCVGSDKKISKREFTNRRLDSNTTATASSALTTGWCSEPKTSGGRLYQRIATKCEGKIFATYDEAAAEYNRIHSIVYPEIGPYDTIWCANKLTVAEYKKWNCDEISGTAHRSKSLAQAEHQRLKNQTSTASSNQAPQQTTARTDSAEIVFWQSIKDSNDPDMFRAYLTKYPEGEFVLLAKINIKKLSDTTVANVAIPNLDYGNYHALVIGNNRYPDFGDLKTPINDARTIARVLKSNYGFRVNVLENATESRIFKAIINLRSTVGRNDNVLIYYGGHGELDNVTDEGFWIPSDAKEDDPSTYLAVDRIRKQIKAMPAKHVMVVADSCFAGSLTRSTLTRALKVKPRSPEYHSELQRISNKKSRTALTSGGLEPVMDSGSDGHSVFAGAFISALEGNDGVLDAHMLFIQVRENVRNNSSQNPEYSPIYETGHDGGDFLFVRQ